GITVGPASNARIQLCQGVFELRAVWLQLNGMTVTGGGKARFTQRFIDEAGKIMAERALVTVLEGVDFRTVDGLHGIAVQFLETALHAAFSRFFLGFLLLLSPQFGDDCFALVGAFDVYSCHVEIAPREAIEREAGAEHDFLVVMSLIG